MDSHFAHLAEGNARQARKRVAADLLIRDEAGRVLLVDPTYKDGWDLPGGMVESNESPQAGVLREIGEELGLSLRIGRPLVVEWVGAHGPWDDQVVFVFDGGVLAAGEQASIRLRDPEIGGWRFVDTDEASALLRESVWWRVRAALDATEQGTTTYRERQESG